MDVAGGSACHEAMPLGSIGQSLGAATQYYMKEELERGLAQLWEAQLQEFLKTVESPHAGLGVPQLVEETAPWDDARAFLASFEQVAEACQWPKEDWVARLLPALRGEAKQTFLTMEVGDRGDYGKLKAAILQGDAMSREKIRQHFRQFCYLEAEGPRGTYNRLQQLCHGWLKVKKHSKEQILELLILEQFLTVLPMEMQNWVRRNCPETCAHAVALAEDFLLGQCDLEMWKQQVAETPVENVQEDECVPLFAMPKQLKPPREPMQPQNSPPLDHRNVGDNKEKEQPQEMPQQIESQGISQEQTNNRPQHCKTGETLENQHTLERKQLTHPREEVGKSVTCEKVNRKTNGVALQWGLSEDQSRNTCFECGKSFGYNSQLLRHKRIHTGERPYRCSRCGKSFICSRSLRRHEKTHTGKKPHTCLECAKAFSDKSSLRRHQRLHTGQKPYECSDCGESFPWITSLDKHRRVHAEETLAVPPIEKLEGEKRMTCICCECGESFSSTSDLDAHRCGFSGEKSYLCLACGKKFVTKSRLKRHQRLHTGERPYKCEDCGERFMWHSSFYRHRKTHTGGKAAQPVPQSPCTQGKNYRCSKCGERFWNECEQKGHQCIPSVDPLRPYKCSDCGEVFRWISSLERHRKNHKREKSVPVLQNMPHTSSIYLQRISTHEKTHKCLKCRKAFNDKWHLRRHQRLHSGEKPYKCTHCGESFMWKSSFETHVKIHTGERSKSRQKAARGKQRSHTCLKCGKMFQKPSLLVRHQKCHSTEKVHKCSECEKSFMHKDSLRRHKRIHAGLEQLS